MGRYGRVSGRIALRARLQLAIVTAAVGTTLLGGAVPADTLAASSPPSVSHVTDISATPVGRALAQQAASRFAGSAVATAATNLIVLQDSTGFTIGPRTATYASVWSGSSSGIPQVEAVPTTIARPPNVKAATRIAPSAINGSWSFVANQCFSRISDFFTWMDHCYVMYRLANDNDSTRDWFALNHYATMQANPPWVMNAASLGSSPAGGSPQSWADWTPRADMTSPCHQITVSVINPAGGIADTTSQCETWSITKSATPGVFSVKWDGRGQRAARELSMELSVSVPQGGWAQWSLPASVSGSPF